MRRIMKLIAICAAIAGIVWLDNARKRAEEAGEPIGDVLRRDVRHFATRRFDPVVMRFGLAGGKRSVWGVIEHVGRTSGMIHHTPVLPMLVGDHLFIRLPFGVEVDWVRNVQTSGHCRLQVHDTIYELDEPAIVGPTEVELVPDWLKAPLERTGRHYLRLHILDRAPAAFAHAVPATDAPPLDVHGEHIEIVEAAGADVALA